MVELPFSPALTCPRCNAAHDFYVTARNPLPFALDALYVYQCPATALPTVIAPVVAPTAADLLALDAVPLTRVG